MISLGNNPLSFKNLLAGIFVTVIGGIILAYIIQDARFAPSSEQLTTISASDTPTFTAIVTSSNTPTSIPKPTSTPTVTPSYPPTSIPTITSTCSTPTYFQDSWKAYPKLGCPTNAFISDFTFQTFEGGVLAWQKSPSPSTVYALFYNGRWQRQTDPGGPPNPSCPEAEQTGGLGPIFGFGTLWCEIISWREQLGMPINAEKDGKNNQIQNFENGTMLTIGAAGRFILYSDSHWEQF